MLVSVPTIDSAYLSEWEAKWSRVAIEHTYGNQSTEHNICVNYPGHNQFWIVGKKGKTLLYDVRRGVGLYNNLCEQKRERKWQKKYGTVCQGDLERDLAMSRQLLYRLHVLVSSNTTLADAYAHAISSKSSDVGNRHVLDFTTSLPYHSGPTTYHVVFNRKTHLPREIVGSWAHAKETVEIAWASPTKCRVDRVFSRRDGTTHEVWNVLNISPLAHEPTDQAKMLAGGYFDLSW